MTLASPDLLKRALLWPESLAALSAEEWSRLLFLARAAALLGRLAADQRALGRFERLPGLAQDHLLAGERVASLSRTRLTWEIDRLKRTFFGHGQRLILLKGAAYYAGDLPCGRGCVSSDIDVLVDRGDLQWVEATLMAAGWEPIKIDAYDQRFYRDWMHELPPMRHRERATVLDVHHTILPLTSRLKPDAAKLLAAARPVGGGIHLLSDADMLLHSAVHLFQDGEIRGGLRDLVDQRDLLAHFGRDPGFWPRLTARAEELGLGRSLYYMLRYARSVLDAPIPAVALKEAAKFAPVLPVRLIMDRLVTAAIFPIFLFETGSTAAIAGRLLYFRSHWLRMPPAMLAGHLGRKAWRRIKRSSSAEAHPAARQTGQ